MAAQTNKPEEIKNIIKETEKSIEEVPSSPFYILLYMGYMFDKQPEKAQQTLEYARYLYPMDSQLANIDKKASEAVASSSAEASLATLKGEKKQDLQLSE